MEIIPAIDLRGGAVVRLLQGNYDRQTTFGDDPVGVARGFEADGAPRIHVVDLDGAREGRRTQAAEVRAVAAAVGIPIELGGGLRSSEDIAEVLADGVDRVVLGTAAVEEPSLIEQALAAHGAERVIVGIDAREGIVSVSGWTESGAIPAPDLLARMADIGVRRLHLHGHHPRRHAHLAELRSGRRHGGACRCPRAAHASSPPAASRRSATSARSPTSAAEGAIIGAAIYLGTLNLAAAVAELG